MSSSEPADLRVVPDTAGEWLYVLGQLEELLLTLALREDDGTELPDLSPAEQLFAPSATSTSPSALLGAVTRRALSPNASSGPDGRYEHMPIRFVRVAGEDPPASSTQPRCS